MSHKSVAAVVIAGQDTAAFDAAIAYARARDAHLTVLAVAEVNTALTGYYADINPGLHKEQVEKARKSADDLEADIASRAEKAGLSHDVHVMASARGEIGERVARVLRFTDVAILPKPYGEKGEGMRAQILEAALFEAPVPVILAPKSDVGQMSRIVVAWNDSQQSLAAVRAAMPLLEGAEACQILSIAKGDEQQDKPHEALGALLSRHGIEHEAAMAEPQGGVTETLQKGARDFGADLLVMGAYGHSRFRESMLGGVTREMLQSAEMPVFMAR